MARKISRFLLMGVLAAVISAGVASQYLSNRQDIKGQGKLNPLLAFIPEKLTAFAAQVPAGAASQEQLVNITAAPTRVDGNTFTLPGDFSAKMAPHKVLLLDLGADGVKFNTVGSSRFDQGMTTVRLKTGGLTANLSRVAVFAAGTSMAPRGAGGIMARDYGSPGRLALQAALDFIGPKPRQLVLSPEDAGYWDVDQDVTLPVNVTLEVQPGAILRRTGGNHLYIRGKFLAGLQQCFADNTANSDWVIFGPSAVTMVHPEWWGAVPDNSSDCLAALQAAGRACANSARGVGTVFLSAGSYKITAPWPVPVYTSIIGLSPEKSSIDAVACDGLVFDSSPGSTSLGPKMISGFKINGSNCGDKVAIKSLGTADISQKTEDVNFAYLRIANFGTGIYGRNLWGCSIENCRFYPVHNGVKFIGQNVFNIVRDNRIEHGKVAGATGTSYGVVVNQANDYNPGGRTGHYPEDIQILSNLIYGFDVAVNPEKGVAVRILNNDLDNSQIYGVLAGSIIDGLQIEKNYLALNGATGRCGIRFAPVKSPYRSPVSVKQNSFSPTLPIAGTINGIEVEANQQGVFEENYVSSINGDALVINGARGVSVINNDLYTTAGRSIFVINTHSGSDYFLDKNRYTTMPVISLTNQGKIQIGRNPGTYVRGKSIIAAGTTSKTTVYGSVYGGYRAFWNIVDSGIYPLGKIINHEPGMGEVQADASANQITIHCTIAPPTDKTVYWEVLAIPRAEQAF